MHQWKRRNFLQLAGGATAGTLLTRSVYALAPAQTEPAKPVTANDHIQIALIGAGGQGQVAAAGEKQALTNGLNNATESRASVLRKVVDGTTVINEGNVQFTTTYGQAFYNQEYRRVFVYMEYIGYLRRNMDSAGFNFWLGKLNFYNGDPFQAEMVRSFILSPEYRSRFGQP